MRKARRTAPLEAARYAISLVVLAAGYVALGKLGLALAPVHRFATLVWLPSGVSLFALLAGGYRLWPGIAAGVLITNLLNGAPPLASLAIAAGNTLEAVVGAWALRRASGFREALDGFAAVVALVVRAAAASTVISATVGTTALVLAGAVPASGLARMWAVWWIGDFMGDLLAVPVLLTWTFGARPSLRPAALAEAAAVAALTAAAAALVFFQPPEAAWATLIFFPYLVFFPLIWAALRDGTRGASTAMAAVALAAVWGTYTGHGSFVRGDRTESLMALQVFLATAALAGLSLGAVASERARTLAAPARDIGERRSVEQSLRESEERQRLAVEAARVGMWFWDVVEGRLAWTTICREMHGMRPDEEVTYARFLAAIASASSAAWRARSARAASTASSTACSCRTAPCAGCRCSAASAWARTGRSSACWA